jgi:hypothetical protein
MKGTSYLLYDIITYPTNQLVYLLERWHNWLWKWAHYKYGNGPRI